MCSGQIILLHQPIDLWFPWNKGKFPSSATFLGWGRVRSLSFDQSCSFAFETYQTPPFAACPHCGPVIRWVLESLRKGTSVGSVGSWSTISMVRSWTFSPAAETESHSQVADSLIQRRHLPFAWVAVHWQKQEETVLQRLRQPLGLWKCALKIELIFKSQKQICILQKTMLFWEGKVCWGFVYLFFDTLDQSWSMVYLKACVHPIRGHHQAFNACAHLQALKLASTRKKNLLPSEPSGRSRNL